MEKVDLEALDAMHAAATPGEWRVSITSNEDSCLGRYVFQVVEYPYKGNHEIFAANPYNRSEEELVADVELTAALHNAYPALAAELRALREERNTLRAEAESIKAKWHSEGCAHCDERPGGHEGTIWCEECFQWWVRESEQEFISQLHTESDTLSAEITAAKGLLARIHGDGGHHTEKVGLVQSVADADSKVVAMCAERDALQEDYRRLEKIRKDLMRRCERMKSLEGMSLDEIAARQLQREDSLRAEVARLREALKAIHKGACLTAQESRSRDDDRYCLADVIQVAGEALSSTNTSEWLAARDAEQRRIGAAEWLEANNERLDTMNHSDVTEEAAKLRREAEKQ